jgi:hypothetical protein
MDMLLILYLAIGLVSVGISLPLIARKIPPNLWYGFRIRQTLEDPEIWYAVNQYFGKRLLVTALTFSAAAVILYFVPGISIDAYALTCLLVFAVVFTFAMLQSLQYMKKF